MDDSCFKTTYPAFREVLIRILHKGPNFLGVPCDSFVSWWLRITHVITKSGLSGYGLRLIFFSPGWFKVQRNGIHAVPQAGGFRAVVENMAKVAVATGAQYFNPDHAVGMI